MVTGETKCFGARQLVVRRSTIALTRIKLPPCLMFIRLFVVCFAVALAGSGALRAWDSASHRMVNRIALASLPPDFPDFVRDPQSVERITFLASEADRWRNVSDPALMHSGGSWSDHFLDFEQIPLAGLDLESLPSFRYDFVVAFAAGRAAHRDRFPVIDRATNMSHTQEWPGFLPWTIVEHYARVKSAFTYLKTYEEHGTAEEIAQAKANVVYLMGVMGHFVGDATQPLHTTDHHNGWVGPNPNGYTTRADFHSWIDGGFLAVMGTRLPDLLARVKPAVPLPVGPRPDQREPVFAAVMNYMRAQHAFVEPLYQMEKAGQFTMGTDQAVVGRSFLEGQLLKSGEMLGALWLTAYRNTAPDVFLRTQLLKRQAAETGVR